MDINQWRSLTTVLLLVVFIGIVVWAYSRRNKQRFDEAAQLPFLDDRRREANAAHTDPDGPNSVKKEPRHE
jgi:cytochrome c oxidase cbb3-type subunit IV